jgi:peptidoglycan hydrolase CwlO-like protein
MNEQIIITRALLDSLIKDLDNGDPEQAGQKARVARDYAYSVADDTQKDREKGYQKKIQDLCDEIHELNREQERHVATIAKRDDEIRTLRSQLERVEDRLEGLEETAS